MIHEIDKNIEKLIYAIAYKYFGNYPNKEDLFQVGYIGYMNALKNYKREEGTKLSTYAYQYIFGEMKKLVREDKTVKPSRGMQILLFKLEKASILLTQELKREPTLNELSEYLKIPVKKLEEIKLSAVKVESLETPLKKDSKEMTLIDTIEDKKKLDLDTLIALKQELSKLPEKDLNIIKYRYIEDKTQSEVAKNLNMSQVQVSREEAKVLKKLRNSLSSC